jgi:general secretion pathway protein K
MSASPRTRAPRTQRGIALVTALVLVAIATVLAATIGFGSVMASQRASTVFGADQALLAAEGAEAMAAYALTQSANLPQGPDSLDQAWAQPYGPYELAPGVTLEFAQIEDQQGKFNINNLAAAAVGGTNGAGAANVPGASDPTQIELFKRLLGALGLESKWAGILADWIDSDINPNDPDGAEDSVYLSQSPPYRAANQPVSSISELLALPGFGRDRYNRLAPYIAALPPGTPINICTASGVLLDAMSGKTEYSLDPASLAKSRQDNGCFPTSAAFQNSLAGQKNPPVFGTASQYYRLRTTITIGTARFNLYSLLTFDGTKLRSILRTFGTE